MQNNVSFTGCIPVEFYAKHPITKKYVPIVKKDNVEKCRSFVVRNLNRSLKPENQNEIFINAYKAYDKDYVKNPVVRSYFDTFEPIPKTAHEPAPRFIYLFTGDDVNAINKLGKELGKEKIEIFEATGEKNNSAVKQARKRFRIGLNDLINKICPRVKDDRDNNVVMRVFFEPKYNKKGNLDKFIFQDVFFDKDSRFHL